MQEKTKEEKEKEKINIIPRRYVLLQYNMTNLVGQLEWTFDELVEAQLFLYSLRKQVDNELVDSFMKAAKSQFFIYELRKDL